jgi:hypothetical protein
MNKNSAETCIKIQGEMKQCLPHDFFYSVWYGLDYREIFVILTVSY